MYFNVFSDTGATIRGYLIPDGFSTRPKINVRAEGVEYGPFECDIFIESTFQHRHHETGYVGFVLDDSRIPDLANALDLEISDSENSFVFYRRLKPHDHIGKRVFRLETQFIPHAELDKSFKPWFQFFASGAERYGTETVRQMLEVANLPSTYVSGRVMLKNIRQYLASNTIRITSLRDPFYELAVRLTAISRYKKHQFAFMSDRDRILFEPAMNHFANTDFNDEDELRAKIVNARKDVLNLFDSPFIHQLVANSPTEKVSREAVAAALEVLSQFTIFDPNEKTDALAIEMADVIGIENAGTIRFSTLQKTFLDIADRLRRIQILEQVLENDLILFHFVKKATERAQSGTI